MPVNYAEKYSSKVDERMKLKEMTNIGLNTNYEWDGVNAIQVYDIPTVALGNYTSSGVNRYGVPEELGDTLTQYELTTDKAFTFTIDKRALDSQVGAKQAGKALAREVDEEVVPFKDKQRLKVWADASDTASNTIEGTTISKTNAYATLLDAQEKLTDNKVPLANRIFYCTAKYYKFLKQDSSFIQASDVAQNMLVKGQVGEIDGVKIVVLPTSYFPAQVVGELVYTKSTISPSKLREYNIHHNPVGINGDLVEGRFMIDTFVLKSGAKSIVAIKEGA